LRQQTQARAADGQGQRQRDGHSEQGRPKFACPPCGAGRCADPGGAHTVSSRLRARVNPCGRSASTTTSSA
jgi:hypothetical protein